MSQPLTQTTGRRKRAVARARLRDGEGVITINGRELETFFPNATHRMILTEPLRLTEVPPEPPAGLAERTCQMIAAFQAGALSTFEMRVASPDRRGSLREPNAMIAERSATFSPR